MIGAKAYLYRKWGSYRFALSVALGLVGAIIIALFGYLFSSQSGLNQGALRTTRSGTGPSSTRVTTEDQRVLFNAEQILIGNCMRQHNFKYLPIPFSPPSQPGNPSPYYITSRAWAQRNGFGGSDPSSSQALDPNQQYYASLTPARKQAYQIAMTGMSGDLPQVLVRIPQGGIMGHGLYGCQATADTKLYGSFRLWFAAYTIIGNLQPTVIGQVTSNPAYIKALTLWSACMRGKGYNWTSPGQAAAAFSWRHDQAPPGESEIRASVTTAQCADSSGLAATANRLNTFYVGKFYANYRIEVNAYRNLQLEAISVARKVVKTAQR